MPPEIRRPNISGIGEINAGHDDTGGADLFAGRRSIHGFVNNFGELFHACARSSLLYCDFLTMMHGACLVDNCRAEFCSAQIDRDNRFH